MTDYSLIFDAPKEPSPRAMAWIDRAAWGLPTFGAVLSGLVGPATFWSVGLAVALGFTAAGATALGVLFARTASRVRDDRLAVLNCMNALNLEVSQHNAPTSAW